MNIIVKHIIGGVIFLAVSVGAAFGAFKYGEYVGNERATEELNRFKGILSKTEESPDGGAEYKTRVFVSPLSLL